MAETRVDSRGHDLTKRRGPAPGHGTGRKTLPIQVRLPDEMREWLDGESRRRGGIGPHGRIQGTGRSGIVIEALKLLMHGDASHWRSRYVAERKLRLAAEARLARAKEALGEL